jgi:hypothetical protein
LRQSAQSRGDKSGSRPDSLIGRILEELIDVLENVGNQTSLFSPKVALSERIEMATRLLDLWDDLLRAALVLEPPSKSCSVPIHLCLLAAKDEASGN